MKTSRIVTRVVCFATYMLASVGAAWAQPISGTASSVEWAAVHSHLIVRALIDDVSVHALKDGLHPNDGRHRYQTVSVRVLETIKGEQITCFVSDAGNLEKLRHDEQELILFLRNNRKQAVPYPEGALEYRTRGLWDDSVIVLDQNAAEVLFADLTWHRHPHEILARLRSVAEPTGKTNAAKASPAMRADTGLPVFSVHPPATIAAESSIAGNPYAVVYLPVNQELEENAGKWAVSNDQDLRWLAARALVYFKSDNNAAILQRLLDDDAVWERRDMLRMTGLSYPHRPEFLVRWEAWHVLAGWGYEVGEPSFTATRRTTP
jgi:hypothetical protein